MREILTIQLGSIANHVGTHFWNAQVSYNVVQYSIYLFDTNIGRVL